MTCCNASTHYLPPTAFSDRYYEVEITNEGLTVYSECCAETMSDETLLKVRDGINAYFAAREASQPGTVTSE